MVYEVGLKLTLVNDRPSGRKAGNAVPCGRDVQIDKCASVSSDVNT